MCYDYGKKTEVAGRGGGISLLWIHIENYYLRLLNVM